MRRFIFNLIIGLFGFLLILEFSCYLLTLNPDFSKKIGLNKTFLGGMRLIEYSKQRINSDTLHIGDSVARQIFQRNPNESNSLNYLTTHAGTLVSGNYELVKNVLENNPQIKTILYGTIPSSLGFDFNEKETSLNYIKPFLSIYNYSKIDTINIEKMKEQPLSFIYLTYAGKFFPMDDINFEKIWAKKRQRSSDYSLYYLEKMLDLCEQHNVKLVLYCPPIDINRKRVFADYRNLRKQDVGFKIRELHNNYLKTIYYESSDKFRDGMHFKNKYAKINRTKLQETILSKIRQTKI